MFLGIEVDVVDKPGEAGFRIDLNAAEAVLKKAAAALVGCIYRLGVAVEKVGKTLDDQA
jgi:hypothetical protein